jgi:Ca2+-binding EF-hand superfamily protein
MSVHSASSSFKGGEQRVVSIVRAKCLSRNGENGIRALSQHFAALEDDRALHLTQEEFRGVLRDCGVVLSDEEFDQLVSNFHSTVISRSVDTRAFLQALKGRMNTRRQTVVDIAFARFDQQRTGMITLETLHRYYDVSRHPQVLAHKLTPEDAIQQFHSHFNSATNPEGIVSKEEFEHFYSGVSATVDSDDYFETLLIRSWNLDKPLETVIHPSEMKIPQSIDDLPGRRPVHPLYQTSASTHGKNLQEAIVPPPVHNRTGLFTKNSPGPWKNSSLNTKLERSRVERGTGFSATNPLL